MLELVKLTSDEMKKMMSTSTIILCLIMIDFSCRNTDFSELTLESCTIFTASYDDKVLFGNNEDYINPKTYHWISPSTSQFYGRIHVRHDNLSLQGGINEKGLAFDYNAVPKVALHVHPERLPLHGNPGFIILEECATVEEAH